LVFWAGAIYWLAPITLAGDIPSVLYLSVFWLVATLVVRAAMRRQMPMWIVLPVVWVALEYVRSLVIGGFPWFYLAHSQYQCTGLIQISDLTGQYGVSVFVAMVSGTIIDALAHPLFVRTGQGGRLTRKMLTGAAACAVSVAGMLIYGSFRLHQSTTRPGPTIGAVQLAFPMSLDTSPVSPEEMFIKHLDRSGLLENAGCDLVVWPESMLGFPDFDPALWYSRDPDGIDPATGRPWMPQQQEIIRTYRASLGRLRGLLGDFGCPLLAGGTMTHPTKIDPANGKFLKTNSALLFDRAPSGQVRRRRQYDKMHLVPFGETVPFREGWPWLYGLLRRFVPEQMPQLAAGQSPVRFEIPYTDADGAARSCRVAVPICYEGVFARVCRKLVMANGQKRAQLLVNLSNDGWFIFATAGWTHASTELDQHLVQYVFRAIENRVPVVRAVNTGISAHIDSNGRIVQTVGREGRRKMVGGNLLAQTLVDERVSLYSLVTDKVGEVFAWAITAAAAMAALRLMAGRKKEKE
ncbi:hypothetical protein LCGC14_1975700, partial [marine sediment metagenome]